MAAYVLVDFEIIDAEGFREYARRVGTTIASYGGTYLVQGATAETLEGDWSPRRLVILEFANIEQAKGWYTSEEYAAIKAIRHKTAHTHIIVVSGNPNRVEKA